MTEHAQKKICIVTGSRAEYGLFYPLLKRLQEDDMFDLQIVATGMHLSPEFGMTFREIEKDGFVINEKVEMLLSSDTETGITKSIGIGIVSFADVFNRLKPDLLIVLGDRFETFAAALSAFIAKIPIAHLHGGELTEGAIDDALRHSITKLSYLHFTSTEQYRRRVVQLGESPDRVFNAGALGIDNIHGTAFLSKEELESRLNFTFDQRTALVTFHPVTLEDAGSEEQFRELLNALEETEELKVIFTKPNADAGGRVIIRLIEEYASENPDKAVSFTSMGKLNYLSAMKHADIVIGNSSSGIIEFPSFGKPTVNIGDRQRGRIRAGSVIDCRPEKGAIQSAIKKALSDDFLLLCKNVKNPYGNAGAAERIVDILKSELSKKMNLKKGFF
ncbi:MAG: UDP-N-acetylglucosamine 2-epimerase (hydrolyzing), partial [Thermodesulfovibrionia bacterium]|nr:UDP-N-acetylglucosamine 2-epimerase (hydrolyzing) [Thermodesulfovibrionia bacterium]